MEPLARLDVSVVGPVSVVRLAGELDMSNAGELEARVLATVGATNPVVVDLSGTTFVDSAGVRLLDHLVAAIEPVRPVRMVVPGSGPVAFTMRLCGFREDLLCGSREEAVAAVTGAT